MGMSQKDSPAPGFWQNGMLPEAAKLDAETIFKWLGLISDVLLLTSTESRIELRDRDSILHDSVIYITLVIPRNVRICNKLNTNVSHTFIDSISICLLCRWCQHSCH